MPGRTLPIGCPSLECALPLQGVCRDCTAGSSQDTASTEPAQDKRCPRGWAGVEQVLEVLFRMLQGACATASEGLRWGQGAQSTSCCQGTDLAGGHCSPSVAAALLAAETRSPGTSLCATERTEGAQSCLVLCLGLAQGSSAGCMQAVAALLLPVQLCQRQARACPWWFGWCERGGSKRMPRVRASVGGTEGLGIPRAQLAAQEAVEMLCHASGRRLSSLPGLLPCSAPQGWHVELRQGSAPGGPALLTASCSHTAPGRAAVAPGASALCGISWLWGESKGCATEASTP